MTLTGSVLWTLHSTLASSSNQYQVAALDPCILCLCLWGVLYLLLQGIICLYLCLCLLVLPHSSSTSLCCLLTHWCHHKVIVSICHIWDGGCMAHHISMLCQHPCQTQWHLCTMPVWDNCPCSFPPLTSCTASCDALTWTLTP